MDALETKNAELQKQVDREYAMRKELGKQYLRAVELLGKVRMPTTYRVRIASGRCRGGS
jgi:hypothetical protein